MTRKPTRRTVLGGSVAPGAAALSAAGIGFPAPAIVQGSRTAITFAFAAGQAPLPALGAVIVRTARTPPKSAIDSDLSPSSSITFNRVPVNWNRTKLSARPRANFEPSSRTRADPRTKRTKDHSMTATTPTFPMRILVASDGSGPSDAAIRLAGELAAKTRSELHVLHVSLMSRYIYPDVMSDAQLDRIKAEGQARLEAEEGRARQSGVEITKSHLRLGRVDNEVLRLADELKVGIIVIGNRSGDAMSRILLGNDAESIVRHAPCAVLVARDEDNYERR